MSRSIDDHESDAVHLSIEEEHELSRRPGMGLDDFTVPDSTSAEPIAQADRMIAAIVRDVSTPPLVRQRIRKRAYAAIAQERRRRSRRNWAVAITSTAAAVLTVAVLQSLARPDIDTDATAKRMSEIYDIVLDDQSPLEKARIDRSWPTGLDSHTCVGFRRTELFGRQVKAYRLASGNDRAVLVVMPRNQFPFRLRSRSLTTSYSARRIDVHYFINDNQVYILVMREGTELDPFRSTAPLV